MGGVSATALNVEVLRTSPREGELAPTGPRVPVILLHGWRHNLWALKPLGELLAPYTEVHLLDLPGYGESAPPGETWGTKEYAERIIAYLDENGIERADFIGHSFGGKISALIASLRPERVRKLVLINASALPPLRTGKQKLRFLGIRYLGKTLKFVQKCTGIRWYHNYFIPRFASADYKASDGPLRQVFVRIVNEDLGEQLKKIQAETLLLWGEKDTETRINIAERLLQILPKASLVTLKGKGHEPFSEAGFHLCAYYISPFLGLIKLPQESSLQPQFQRTSVSSQAVTPVSVAPSSQTYRAEQEGV